MRNGQYYTVKELAAGGVEGIPEAFLPGSHLIYSSPATLAYHSPGAEGFGVKRAGLALPGSVMLVVSPGCCGRNTSGISELPAYRNRFFYLTMDETDLVTGRHLNGIVRAAEEITEYLSEQKKTPSVIMICVTCVDALLGTDLERVCRRAEEACHVPVRPCYMYALTREGKKPPMVHVRQSLYSMLEPRKKDPRAVNLLGFFAPLIDDFELYRYLEKMGVRTIREISRCEDFEAFLEMAEANFNLLLFPEAREAAADLTERCGIPSIELSRFYDIDRVGRQYRSLAHVLGTEIDDEEDALAARQAVLEAKEAGNGPVVCSVGESMNGNPFEMASALVKYGFFVKEIFGTVNEESIVYLKHLAEVSPETRVYSNQDPTMVDYRPETEEGEAPLRLTIGRDAGYYHTECPCIPWNSDRQPYGYAGIRALFQAIRKALSEEGEGR